MGDRRPALTEQSHHAGGGKETACLPQCVEPRVFLYALLVQGSGAWVHGFPERSAGAECSRVVDAQDDRVGALYDGVDRSLSLGGQRLQRAQPCLFALKPGGLAVAIGGRSGVGGGPARIVPLVVGVGLVDVRVRVHLLDELGRDLFVWEERFYELWVGQKVLLCHSQWRFVDHLRAILGALHYPVRLSRLVSLGVGSGGLRGQDLSGDRDGRVDDGRQLCGLRGIRAGGLALGVLRLELVQLLQLSQLLLFLWRHGVLPYFLRSSAKRALRAAPSSATGASAAGSPSPPPR